MRPSTSALVLVAVLASLTDFSAVAAVQPAPPAREAAQCSILVYHRFATVADGFTTVRVSTFRWQLDYLEQHEYSVLKLRALVESLERRGPPLPRHCVVLTADDGHESVFAEMLPIVREHRVPVTVFVYPSAIGHASYAMTWDELETLVRSGLFDVQSHTYWHPNFDVERRRLSADEYRAFVTMQLRRSRAVIEERLGVRAEFLAWPFGIYNDELLASARAEGYAAGFTLERKPATTSDRIMALPRFLVSDASVGASFEAMLPR